MSGIFETLLKSNILTAKEYFLCLLAALGCGVITAVAASIKSRSSKSFIVSLVLLPMIVHTVIVMVNGDVGTGVAVMGAFSLVRFRSVAGKAKEIAAIFLVMTAGLACAAGYAVLALVFTAVVSAVMLALSLIPMRDQKSMELNIFVPEALRFADAFDDLFAEYTKSHKLVKIKTSNMGSLYKLFYRIELKDKSKMQEFIDKIRCRNGNLEITVCEYVEGVDEL